MNLDYTTYNIYMLYSVRRVRSTHFPFPVGFSTFRYGVRSTSSLSRLGLHFNLLLTFLYFFVPQIISFSMTFEIYNIQYEA